MTDFDLDQAQWHAFTEGARSGQADLSGALERARTGCGLPPEDMAALWYAPNLETEALYELALRARAINPTQLETFAPLYLTNTCDGECRMCGMRRDNPALERDTAEPQRIDQQLGILQQRGMRAVALVTGEYRAAKRRWAMRYVNEALHRALQMGFEHVLLNIGGIDDAEFPLLLDGVARDGEGNVQPPITLCTFQETYSRAHYARFMGTDPDNPRADFDRRLTCFDRAHRAGLRSANLGILLGLNPDLGSELTAFAMHARHLRARGMQVYLSVPRLRPIAGKRQLGSAGEEEFVRLVSLLSVGLPDCKIVITTREPPHVQHKLAPIVTVLSAGSSAVAPYTESSARYRVETSQFVVLDQRPFEEILGEHLTRGGSIKNFCPPVELFAR